MDMQTITDRLAAIRAENQTIAEEFARNREQIAAIEQRNSELAALTQQQHGAFAELERWLAVLEPAQQQPIPISKDA